MPSERAEKMLEQCPHSKTKLKQFQCAQCYDEAWARVTSPLEEQIETLTEANKVALDAAAEVLTPIIESRWGAMIGKDVLYTAMRNIRAITPTKATRHSLTY